MNVMTEVEKSEAVIELKRLWEEHDIMERKILQLERKFTDAELDILMNDDDL